MIADRQHRLDDDHQQSRSSGCGAARHRRAPLPTPPRSPRPPRRRAGRRARRCRRRSAAPTRPITASPGMPSASAIAGLGGDDPEADLAHLLGDRRLVAFGELLGDDRREDRIEAGLQLLRQRGDLLGDIIDADIAGETNRPRMAMSSRREPHSIASAAASGMLRRATASSAAGFGRQPRGQAVASTERPERRRRGRPTIEMT